MQQQEDIRFTGRLDMDSDDLVIRKGDHSYAMNALFIKPMNAVLDSLGTVKAGNHVVTPGTYVVVGALDAGQYVFYALSGPVRQIVRYNTDTEIHDVVVDETYLNFSAGSYVKFQYNEDLDILYWTDGKFGSFQGSAQVPLGHNPPRQVNVDKAIRYYASGGTDPLGYSSMSQQHLDVIKYPSLYPVTAEYITDEDFNVNLIQGKMFQFTLQYVYEDFTRSVWTIWSQVALPTISESDEALISLRDNDIQKFQNALRVTFNTGHETAKKIRLAVRDSNTGVVGVFKTLDKSDLGYADETEESIVFRGDEGLEIVSFDDLYNYSLVPVTANDNALVSSGNEGQSLVYGGIREGFDGIVPDVDMAVFAHKLYNGRPWNGILNTYFDWREVIRREDYLGLGVDSFLNCEELNLIPLEHLLFESFAFKVDMSFDSSGYEYLYFTPTDMRAHLGQVDTTGGAAKVFAAAILDKLALLGYTGMSLVSDGILFASVASSGTSWVGEMQTYNPRRPSFKKGAQQPIGITYFDRAKRDGGVYELGDAYVPFDKEIFEDGLWSDNVTPVRTSVRALINHVPPDWAEYYSLVYQGNKHISSFERRVVVSILEYPSDGYVRLFLDNWHLVAFDEEGDFTAHVIEEGDIIRIVTNPEDLTGPYTPPEFSDYEELVVLRSENNGGGYDYIDVTWNDSADYISAGSFPNLGTNSGMLVEILTRKSQSELAPYYTMGKVYPIINPHLTTRYHGGESVDDIACEIVKGLNNYVDVYGDYSWLDGAVGIAATMTITDSPGNNGTYVISAITMNYSQSVPITRLFTLTPGMTVDDGVGNIARVAIQCNQSISPAAPAIALLDRGDVYCRQTIQRFRITFPSAGTSRDLNEIAKPFWVESFHYTDKYISDSYDKGQPYVVLSDDQGFKYNRALLRNSLNYIAGTLVNGLSSFTGPNRSSVAERDGAITRLVLVGYTLKVIQPDKNTSIYISREEVANADGSNQLVTVNRVLGGTRPDKQPYGTTHPYSVAVVDADVYYFDQKRKAVVKDTPGGQVLLTDNNSGVNQFIGAVSGVLSTNVTIVAAHDRRNSLVLFSMIVKGSPSQSFTLSYDYIEGHWVSFYGYTTNMYVTSDDDRIYCFNANNLYELNVGNPREYFDVYSDFNFDVVANPFPTVKKVFDNHELASSEIIEVNPITIPADPENASGMETNMSTEIQEVNEGTVFCAYPMDRNSPGFGAGQEDWAMIEGRPMRGLSLRHRYLKSGAAIAQIRINHVIVRFTPSEPI